MAREKTPQEIAAEEEKKKIKAEKSQLKKDQKAQKKEAKRRAKEIAKREDELEDEEESGGFATFFTTLFIVALWLVVICVVVKMDVGGFGSSVLTPVLKDVPVVNKILPGNSVTETTNGDNYGGYTSLKDAVAQIESLELQLEQAQNESKSKDEELSTLKAEVLRLQPFEEKQVEFQRIRTEFYEEVIYAENGPGAEEYQKYYESMDPTTAEYLYKQVVAQNEASQEIQDYAATYSQMKPKAAAALFEAMDDDLDLVADILMEMGAESRAAILNNMDATVAAKLTKIMNPDS
jgi:flagellar motility protein MotE (MotC chaperone)